MTVADRPLVLVADDEADIRSFVAVNLRLEGFDTATAEDGEEALEQALLRKPDLILLDVMMPKLDGFAVMQRLRADLRTQMIPIIMLTARSQSADKVVGLTAGADDYIIKPFDPLELVARVKSTLRRNREMRGSNPLTHLPGNTQIHDELTRRIDQGHDFALLYIDLDNFKAFNDHYGFLRGDEAIKRLSDCAYSALAEHGGEQSFIGHIGGDDFVGITAPEAAEPAAKDIIACWDESVRSLSDASDIERGYIEVRDRRDQPRQYPITSVSIGIVTTTQRSITSHWQASEIAAEMKHVAKKDQGSSYAVDRRRGA